MVHKYNVDIPVGHGGFDPGAVNGDTKESNGTLGVALKLAVLLRNNDIGANLSRTTDVACGGATNVTADVNNQINFVNKSSADIAVAIHFNSAINKTANGVEVLYSNYPAQDAREIRLATYILTELANATGMKSRGIKEIPSGIGIIKHVRKPCVLSENGFISNDIEKIWCSSEDHQWIIAEAHARAICKYFGVPHKERKVDKSMEQWKLDIISNAKKEGIITSDHNPDDGVTKWFVLQVAINVLKIIRVGK